jgi:hypothetical protein
VDPLKLVSISCTLGIGNATLCSFEFKTLKSDTTLTVPFFFGIVYWNLELSLTFSYICVCLWLSIRDTIYLLCENSDENYYVLAIV